MRIRRREFIYGGAAGIAATLSHWQKSAYAALKNVKFKIGRDRRARRHRFQPLGTTRNGLSDRLGRKRHEDKSRLHP